MKDDRIQAALEKNLSHITLSNESHQRIYNEITGGNCRLKNKWPAVFAAAALLILLIASSALAVSITDWVKDRMQPYADTYGWGIEERLSFLHLMQDWGVEMDTEALTELDRDYAEKRDHMTLDELDEFENRAGKLIYEWYFPLHGPFEAAQQEQYPMPSFEVLYAYLYRTQNPEASDAEIAEAFAAWREDWQNTHADKDQPTRQRPVEEAIRADFKSWLYEHLYISEQTLRRFEITLRYNEDSATYRAMGQVDCAYLDESQIEHLIYLEKDQYRDGPVTDGQSMFWYRYYDQEGNPLGENLERYEYERLIPSTVYWTDDEEMSGQVTRVFRNFSLAQRAAFSQTYKPIVDTWLEAHPDFAAYLAAAPQRGEGYDYIYEQTRHVYSLPPADALQEEEIAAIAWDWFVGLYPDIPAEFFAEYYDLYLYYVLRDEGPEWKARIFCDWALHDTSSWGEKEFAWERTASEKDSAVFDSEGNLLREEGDLLPEDRFEGLW